MSMVGLLNAERIKMLTTRSTLWIAATVAALSLVLAAAQGALAHTESPLPPERTAIGIAVFGVPVLMVLASMTMTAEYRSGMIRTTFIAAPARTMVLVGKATVVAVFSAVYAGLMAIGSVVIARLFATSRAATVSLASPDAQRVVVVIAVYAALAAVLGVAVGAILRAAPGAVAVLLLWPLVVEPMLANLPDVGTAVGPYLPFGNVFIAADVPWLYPVYDMPWGPGGSLLYFAALVAAVLGAAIVVLNARDA
ncbi:ABC transporter permease [Mycolicibacterium sp. XJ1819]